MLSANPHSSYSRIDAKDMSFLFLYPIPKGQELGNTSADSSHLQIRLSLKVSGLQICDFDGSCPKYTGELPLFHRQA